MTRTQYSFRVIYKKTTSHQPEGLYDVAYVWALDHDDAKQVFRKNYNNKNDDGTLSSINYEILDTMHYDGTIEIEK